MRGEFSPSILDGLEIGFFRMMQLGGKVDQVDLALGWMPFLVRIITELIRAGRTNPLNQKSTCWNRFKMEGL